MAVGRGYEKRNYFTFEIKIIKKAIANQVLRREALIDGCSVSLRWLL